MAGYKWFQLIATKPMKWPALTCLEIWGFLVRITGGEFAEVVVNLKAPVGTDSSTSLPMGFSKQLVMRTPRIPQIWVSFSSCYWQISAMGKLTESDMGWRCFCHKTPQAPDAWESNGESHIRSSVLMNNSCVHWSMRWDSILSRWVMKKKRSPRCLGDEIPPMWRK